jgi:CRP-like cAMP-binding protein
MGRGLPDELVRALAETPLFRTLGGSEVQAIADTSEEARVSAGAVLAVPGADADALYFIAEGIVSVPSVDTHSRTEKLLSAPDIFGFAQLVAPHQHLAGAYAVTDCRLVRIPIRPLLALLEADEAVGRRVWREVVRQFAGRIEEILALAAGRPGPDYYER